MKLSTIFEHLISSELSRHSLGSDLIDNKINPINFHRVVPMINLGIVSLYTKFSLDTEQVMIDMMPGISMYHLNFKHCLTNTDPLNTLPRYIADSIYRPFHQDRLVKIVTIHNEDGEEKFLNDHNQRYSLFLPNSHTIQHPYPDEENSISVIYQAKPVPFPMPECTEYPAPGVVQIDDCNRYLELERDIPDTILPALLYFVASRVHINLTNNETMTEANFFKGQYLKEVDSLKVQMIETTHFHTNDNINEQGWQ